MKKITNLFITTIVLVTLMLVSCTKEEIAIQSNESTFIDGTQESVLKEESEEISLHQDVRFHELVLLQGSITSQISLENRQAMAEDYLLESIFSTEGYGDEVSEESLAELAEVFGYEEPSDLLQDFEAIQSLGLELNSDYSLESLTEDEILDLVVLYDPFFFDSDFPQINNPCEDQRQACLSAALATAVVGHLVCAAADVTVLLGIACHAAVFANQAVTSNGCNLSAANCNGQNSGGAYGYGFQYYYNLYMSNYIGLVPQVNLAL